MFISLGFYQTIRVDSVMLSNLNSRAFLCVVKCNLFTFRKTKNCPRIEFRSKLCLFGLLTETNLIHLVISLFFSLCKTVNQKESEYPESMGEYKQKTMFSFKMGLIK